MSTDTDSKDENHLCKKRVLRREHILKGVYGGYEPMPDILTHMDGVSPTAKLLWIKIVALSSCEEGWCYAANSYFVKYLHICERSVRVLLSELQANGLLEVVMRDKTHRLMRTLAPPAFDTKPCHSEWHTKSNHARRRKKIAGVEGGEVGKSLLDPGRILPHHPGRILPPHDTFSRDCSNSMREKSVRENIFIAPSGHGEQPELANARKIFKTPSEKSEAASEAASVVTSPSTSCPQATPIASPCLQDSLEKKTSAQQNPINDLHPSHKIDAAGSRINADEHITDKTTMKTLNGKGAPKFNSQGEEYIQRAPFVYTTPSWHAKMVEKEGLDCILGAYALLNDWKESKMEQDPKAIKLHTDAYKLSGWAINAFKEKRDKKKSHRAERTRQGYTYPEDVTVKDASEVMTREKLEQMKKDKALTNSRERLMKRTPPQDLVQKTVNNGIEVHNVA